MKPNFGNAGSVDNALTRAKERIQSRLTKTLATERAAADLGEAPMPIAPLIRQALWRKRDARLVLLEDTPLPRVVSEPCGQGDGQARTRT